MPVDVRIALRLITLSRERLDGTKNHGFPNPWLYHKIQPKSKKHYFVFVLFDMFVGDIGKFEVPRPIRIDPDRSWPISSKFDLFYIDLDFYKKKLFFLVFLI